MLLALFVGISITLVLVLRNQMIAATLNAELLIIMQYNISGFATNAVDTVPAFEQSREDTTVKWGNNTVVKELSVRYFQRETYRTCDEVATRNVADLAESLYSREYDVRRRTCYAMVTNGKMKSKEK